jgi:hypothetical protein
MSDRLVRKDEVSVFAEECPELRIGQQPAAQLPWFHIVTLITKLRDAALREWYAREALIRRRRTQGARIQAGARGPAELLSQCSGCSDQSIRRCPYDRIIALPYRVRLVAECACPVSINLSVLPNISSCGRLPEPLDTNLPSIEEIEAELSRDLEGQRA